MASPARYSSGVTNVPSSDLMGQLIIPDPSSVHMYYNHFDTYAAGDWTVTETQAAATEALTDADGGALLITNSAADNDLVGMQLVGESFTFESGKKLWGKVALTLGDATQSDCIVGLHVLDTSPIATAPSDGVYFRKDDGDTNWDFVIVASSASVIDVAAIGTATTSKVILGFYFDGVDTFEYYFNDAKIGESTTTGFPTTALSVSHAIQNGEAAAKTLTMDLHLWIKEG